MLLKIFERKGNNYYAEGTKISDKKERGRDKRKRKDNENKISQRNLSVSINWVWNNNNNNMKQGVWLFRACCWICCFTRLSGTVTDTREIKSEDRKYKYTRKSGQMFYAISFAFHKQTFAMIRDPYPDDVLVLWRFLLLLSLVLVNYSDTMFVVLLSVVMNGNSGGWSDETTSKLVEWPARIGSHAPEDAQWTSRWNDFSKWPEVWSRRTCASRSSCCFWFFEPSPESALWTQTGFPGVSLSQIPLTSQSWYVSISLFTVLVFLGQVFRTPFNEWLKCVWRKVWQTVFLFPSQFRRPSTHLFSSSCPQTLSLLFFQTLEVFPTTNWSVRLMIKRNSLSWNIPWVPTLKFL